MGDPGLDCHSVCHTGTSLNSAGSLLPLGFAQAVPSAWVALLTLRQGHFKGFLSLIEISRPLGSLMDKVRCSSSAPASHLSPAPWDLAPGVGLG